MINVGGFLVVCEAGHVQWLGSTPIMKLVFVRWGYNTVGCTVEDGRYRMCVIYARLSVDKI